MLAGDISLTEFGATGTHFVVSYEITQESPVLPPGDPRGEIPPFTVSVYRSYDGVTLHGLVGTHNVTLDEERAVGKHTIGIGADFSDVPGDYRLIAVADRFNKVAETSEDNNRAAFRGGAALTADGTLHVHASDAADMVTINVVGDRLKLKVNHWSLDYAVDAVREVHARLHGGDDVFKTLGRVAQNIHVFGGEGDDRITTSAGSDSLFGGDGHDILFAGSESDLLVGDDGDDIMHGGAGPDSLYGLKGNDLQFGGGGKDTLDGGEGDDTLHAGSSEDKSRGGQGRDRFVDPDRNELQDREPNESTIAALTSDDLAAESLVFGDVSSGENSISAMSSSSGGYGYSYGTVWLDYGGAALPEENSNNVHTFTIRREYWRTYTSFQVQFTVSGSATYWTEYWMTGADVYNWPTVTGYAYFNVGQETIPLYVSVVDDYWEENDESITVTLLDLLPYDVVAPYTATAYILDDEVPWGDLDIMERGVELSEFAEDSPGGKLLAGGPAAEIRVSDLSLPLDHYAVTFDSRFTISQSPDGSNPIQNWGEVTSGTYYVRSNVPGQGWVYLAYDSWPNGNYGWLDGVKFNVRLPRFSVELRDAASTLDVPEQNTLNQHVFTIRRNAEDVGVAKTVNYTVSGNATSGTDYTQLSGSVSFGPNDLTKEILVTALNDIIFEGNETLTVTLSTSTQYDVIGGPATATIIDDDIPAGDLDFVEEGVVLSETAEDDPGGNLIAGEAGQLRLVDLKLPIANATYTLVFPPTLVLSRNADGSNPLTSGETQITANGTVYVWPLESSGAPVVIQLNVTVESQTWQLDSVTCYLPPETVVLFLDLGGNLSGTEAPHHPMGITEAQWQQLENDRAGWLAGFGEPTVPSSAKSYDDLLSYVQTAEGRLQVARNWISDLIALESNPNTTPAQYLEELRSATWAYDVYIFEYRKTTRVLKQFLEDQWHISDSDEALADRVDDLPIRLEGLEMRLTPEQWDGVWADQRAVGKVLDKYVASLDYVEGAIQGGLQTLAVGGAVTGVLIAAAAFPVLAPIALNVGAGLLGAGLGRAAGVRWEDNQSAIEIATGAISDVTGFSDFYVGVTARDPVTGQHVQLTPNQQGELLGRGLASFAFSLTGLQYANGRPAQNVTLDLGKPVSWLLGRNTPARALVTPEGFIVPQPATIPITISSPAAHVQAISTVVAGRQIVVYASAYGGISNGSTNGDGYDPDDYTDNGDHLSLSERQQRIVAHDIGVQQGGEHVTERGLLETDFFNPFGDRGPFGQGFDDVRIDADGNYWIVEYKGGQGALHGNQMQKEWILGNIERLRNHAGDFTGWGRRLYDAFNAGKLRGTATSTPYQNGIVGDTITLGDWVYLP